MGVVPKGADDLQLVKAFDYPNQFDGYSTLVYETVGDFMTLLHPGMHLTKYDYKAAYHMLSLHPSCWQALLFSSTASSGPVAAWPGPCLECPGAWHLQVLPSLGRLSLAHSGSAGRKKAACADPPTHTPVDLNLIAPPAGHLLWGCVADMAQRPSANGCGLPPPGSRIPQGDKSDNIM